MAITGTEELEGMRRVSEAVGVALARMRAYAQVGMSARELDEYGGKILREYGANSAPKVAYDFPGWTCISVNEEVAHGIPGTDKVFREGDLINIDVSAELGGFWSDNGGSFVLGEDKQGHQPLVQASKTILWEAIHQIRTGVRIAHIGWLIERAARKQGYEVIRNLTGHGVGRSLHEAPSDIANYYNRFNWERFRRHSVVAVETFISTKSTLAEPQDDGWTLVGNYRGYVAQHEHTIVVTDDAPIILTACNGIWNNL